MTPEHQGLPNRRVLVLGVVLGIAVASLWMPWLNSGARTRHAFELLDTANELDLGPELLRGVWKLLLPLVPLLAAVGFLAVVTARRVLSLVAVSMLVLAIEGGVLVVVLQGLDRGYGTAVAGVSCGLAAYLSIDGALSGQR